MMHNLTGIWYNVIAVKPGIEFTLRFLKLLNCNTLMESHLEGDYRLLSIRTVSKKLGIGYIKAKNLVISGTINSVFDGKKYKVPEFRLTEYLNRNAKINYEEQTYLKLQNNHEVEAEEIIKSMRRI